MDSEGEMVMDLYRIKEIEAICDMKQRVADSGLWLHKDDVVALCRLAKIGLNCIKRANSDEGPAWVREAARDWGVDA